VQEDYFFKLMYSVMYSFLKCLNRSSNSINKVHIHEYLSCWLWYCIQFVYTDRAGPRLVGAPSRLTIWRPGQENNSVPLKTKFFFIFFFNFSPRTGLAKIFKTRDQVANNFLRNSLACQT